MPIIYRCSRCGHIIEIEIGKGHTWSRRPIDVVANHPYCPKCGKTLKTIPNYLTIEKDQKKEHLIPS